ncbi:MAG: DNA primase [Coriobacteriales bacterium]|nr:DNA primase [Coriobacteriales bacterium]
MRTDDDVKDQIRAAVDIVELVSETVQLRQRGRDFWGCCPFHNEKTSSFHVRPDNGYWHCFGCGKGGDIFTFVMERDHVDYRTALETLADKAGVELPVYKPSQRRSNEIKKPRLIEAMEAAVEYYHTQLMRGKSEGAAAARAYLAGRNFGTAIAKEWHLGFALGKNTLVRHLTQQGFTQEELIAADLAFRRDNGYVSDVFYDRIMFPIYNDIGKCVALSGRVIGAAQSMKYRNTRETAVFQKRRTLYALDLAKQSIAQNLEAIVMEGYTDVIASHVAGITNVVAACGTAFTFDHIKLLERFLTPAGQHLVQGRIVCIFDGDAAGLNAAERAMSYVGYTAAEMVCVVIPDNMDPAEYIAAHGADAFKKLVSTPQPLVRFVVDRHLERYNLQASPEERARALQDVVQAMAPLKGTMFANEYIEYVASKLLCDADTVKQALAQVRAVPAPMLQTDRENSGDVVQTQINYAQKADANRAQGSGTAKTVTALPLNARDARMVRLERRVLFYMSINIDAFRGFAERIGQIEWTDARHEAIAWAMMATPAGTDSAGTLAAAEAVCSEAAQIIAGGMDNVVEDIPDARSFDILLDDLAINNLRRRIEAARIQIRNQSALSPEELSAVYNQVVQDQASLTALESKRTEMA